MTGFVNLDAAYDIGTLTDWYISSVTDDPPVRTDEHIEKLFNDFYVIPKDTPATDVSPVKHGRGLASVILKRLSRWTVKLTAYSLAMTISMIIKLKGEC